MIFGMTVFIVLAICLYFLGKKEPEILVALLPLGLIICAITYHLYESPRAKCIALAIEIKGDLAKSDLSEFCRAIVINEMRNNVGESK